VRKKWILATLGLATVCCSLYGQDNFSDVGQETLPLQQEALEGKPYQVQAFYDYIGKAKIDEDDFSEGRVGFREGEIEGSMVVYYQPCFEEVINVSLGYINTDLDWSENPWFDQNIFDTLNLSVGGITKRVDNWLWQAQLSANFDIKHFDFSDYVTYDLLLWGRYDWCSNFGVHFGFLAQTGMRVDRVYPIIGFDWQYDCNWKFNVIFPMNISAVYTVNENWNVLVGTRFFDSRHRAGPDEVLPRAIFTYRSVGLEGGVNYVWEEWLKANVHAGYIVDAELKIADRQYHHRHHYALDGSGYVGGEVTVSF